MAKQNAPRGLDFWLPIGIAAVAIAGVVVMVVASWPRTPRAPEPAAAPRGTAALMPPPAAPPAIQSPRERADELFNRAMMAHETGQAQQAAALIPEAIAAYQGLEPLDADGLFHLASLRLATGNDAEARAASERILADAPNHLLGLATAAQASEQSAPNEAKEFWQRYLDALGEQQQGRLREYAHHQKLLSILSQRANEYVGRTSGAAAGPAGTLEQPVR